MEKAKISIIIPVFNAENFLKKCLEALINQTFHDIEILCINDGSTDYSLEILREYEQKDKRIKVFNQPNSGAAVARNVGLRNAVGSYIMFCDSDDTYEPTMCEAMFNAIESERVDLVMCDCNIVETDGHGRLQKSIEYKRLKIKGKRTIDLSLSIAINTLIWNKIFKKELIDEYEISFSEGYEGDDAAFYSQYIFVAETYFGLDLKLYNQLLRKDSIMGRIFSTNDIQKKLNRIRLIHYEIDFLQKHPRILTEKNRNYIFQQLDGALHFLWPILFKRHEQHKALKLTHEMLMGMPIGDFYKPILKLIIEKEYEKAAEILNKKFGIRFFLGIRIKKQKDENNEIYFMGKKQLYRKEKSVNGKNYFLFGVKVYEKSK